MYVVVGPDAESVDANRLQHDEDLGVCIHINRCLASIELLESGDFKVVVGLADPDVAILLEDIDDLASHDIGCL